MQWRWREGEERRGEERTTDPRQQEPGDRGKVSASEEDGGMEGCVCGGGLTAMQSGWTAP